MNPTRDISDHEDRGIERALRALDAALEDVRALAAEMTDAPTRNARRQLARPHVRACVDRRRGRRA